MEKHVRYSQERITRKEGEGMRGTKKDAMKDNLKKGGYLLTNKMTIIC